MLIHYWPTDFTVVTGRFGTNPDYYRQFNLPGHDGIDFRTASSGYASPVYSCTTGAISFIGYRSPRDPYGYQVRVRLRFEDRDYEIVYAHLVENSCRYVIGQQVQPGQVLGTGGETGNARGAHLHFSLMRAGASSRRETSFPFDLIDPEPYFRQYISTAGIEVDWQ